jgi:hypothetical protein
MFESGDYTNMPDRGRFFTLLLGPVVLWCAAGCSHFERDYQTALDHGPYSKYDGAWEGTWESKTDGDRGVLRCLVTQTGETQFKARFKASYKQALTYEYTISMTGTVGDFGLDFTGRENLPLHGVYEWSGQISGDDFTAEYKTDDDQGVFTMTRPGRSLQMR